MRAVPLFLALLLSAAALTGCVGGDDKATPAATDGDTPPIGTGDGDGDVVEPITVLAPLTTTITTTAPKWAQAGDVVNVTAAVPAKAKGDVKYTWAIGALPGTVTLTPAGADTKEIEPGQSAAVKYTSAGVYAMHCHPHPYMKHNVTVVDGYTGPKEVEVKIVDGSALGDFRFVPENVVIPVDGIVTYKNIGTQMHTATQESQAPGLKALPLDAASGEVKLEGEGWQRLVVIMQDSEGRIGSAEVPVYVTASLPENFQKTETFSFNVGGAPEAEGPQSKSFALDYNGTMFLNFTAVDAVSGTSGQADANLAQVEIHLKEQGATQDTLTSEPAGSGALTGRVNPKTYSLEVIPVQGVGIEATVLITVLYELEPPAPKMAGASGGHDDHGGGSGGHNH